MRNVLNVPGLSLFLTTFQKKALLSRDRYARSVGVASVLRSLSFDSECFVASSLFGYRPIKAAGFSKRGRSERRSSAHDREMYAILQPDGVSFRLR
jgi:hypothetical protein